MTASTRFHGTSASRPLERPGSCRWALIFILAVALVVSGCVAGVGRTHEPGVEHLEAASFVVRIDPPDAIDDRQIVLTSYDDEPTVAFPGRREEDRFLSGYTLPSTFAAWVDGTRCAGSIELPAGTEADRTLTIEGDVCSLRLDLRHREGAIDRGLEDYAPAPP